MSDDLTRALINDTADTLGVTLNGIRTQINHYGLTDYVIISGDVLDGYYHVVIGPSYDPQDGTTHGYDLSIYDGLNLWEQIRQDWCATAEAAVQTALEWLRDSARTAK
jgi:hypothetical protein